MKTYLKPKPFAFVEGEIKPSIPFEFTVKILSNAIKINAFANQRMNFDFEINLEENEISNNHFNENRKFNLYLVTSLPKEYTFTCEDIKKAFLGWIEKQIDEEDETKNDRVKILKTKGSKVSRETPRNKNKRVKQKNIERKKSREDQHNDSILKPTSKSNDNLMLTHLSLSLFETTRNQKIASSADLPDSVHSTEDLLVESKRISDDMFLRSKEKENGFFVSNEILTLTDDEQNELTNLPETTKREKEIDLQARKILNEVRRLCKENNVSVVGLPIFTHHDRTLKIHEVYGNNLWKTGISELESPLAARIEKLLKKDYDDLQSRIKFLPITSSQVNILEGVLGPTREVWVRDDLRRMKEFMQNGGALVKPIMPFPASLSPRAVEFIQKTMTRFEADYPFNNLDRLYQALHNDELLQTLNLNVQIGDDIQTAITKEQKQWVVINKINAIEAQARIDEVKSPLNIPDFSDEDLKTKLPTLINIVSPFQPIQNQFNDGEQDEDIQKKNEGEECVENYKQKYRILLENYYLIDHPEKPSLAYKLKYNILNDESFGLYENKRKAAEFLNRQLTKCKTIKDIEEFVNFSVNHYTQTLSGSRSNIINIFNSMKYDMKHLRDLDSKPDTKDSEYKLWWQLKFGLHNQLLIHKANHISAERVINIKSDSLEEWLSILQAEYDNSNDRSVFSDILKMYLSIAAEYRAPAPIYSDMRGFVRPIVDALLQYIKVRENSLFRKWENDNDTNYTARIKKAGELAHALLRCKTRENLEKIMEDARLFQSKLKANGAANSDLISILTGLRNKGDFFISGHDLPVSGQRQDINRLWKKAFKQEIDRNNPLYQMGKDLSALPDKNEVNARRSAVAIALRKSINNENRRLGRHLVEKMTPEKIEEYRRECPNQYYLQLCLARLKDSEFDRHKDLKTNLIGQIQNNNLLSIEDLYKELNFQLDLAKAVDKKDWKGASRFSRFLEDFIQQLPHEKLVSKSTEGIHHKLDIPTHDAVFNLVVEVPKVSIEDLKAIHSFFQSSQDLTWYKLMVNRNVPGICYPLILKFVNDYNVYKATNDPINISKYNLSTLAVLRNLMFVAPDDIEGFKVKHALNDLYLESIKSQIKTSPHLARDVFYQEKRMNKAIKKLHKSADKSVHEDVEPDALSEHISNILSQLKTGIKTYEEAKYPESHYTYSRMRDQETGRETIEVLYDGLELNDDDFANIRMNAVKVRKLNLIAGVINAMQFAKKDYLDVNTAMQSELINMLHVLSANHHLLEANKNEKYDLPNGEVAEMNNFVEEMVKIIKTYSKEDDDQIIRKIRNAERYFIAENNQNRELVFKTQMDEKDIIQRDIPYNNKLTLKQKMEFVKIHNRNIQEKPFWYVQLPKWEQRWLLSWVPNSDDLNDDKKWVNFENLFQSSAMQHIPGIKNARYHQLEYDGKCISSNFNTSTMVAYEMGKNTQDNTEMTAEQTIQAIMERDFINHQLDFFNIFPLKELENSQINYQPIILIQQLLSDLPIFGSFDRRISNEQVYAVEKLESPIVMAVNDPTNKLRDLTSMRWEHTKKIMKYAETFCNNFRNSKNKLNTQEPQNELSTQEPPNELSTQEPQNELTEAQKSRLNLIERCISALSQIENFGNTNDFNLNAYKVAYECILVESMGGAVSINCKSGKDRTGYEELYKDSLRLFYERNNRFPDLNHIEDDDHEFITIFKILFNSMKTQEAAACNTPGAFGLKDKVEFMGIKKSNMLCPILVKALGGSYHLSNALAETNKPQKFVQDEAKQLAENKNAIILKSQMTADSNPPYQHPEPDSGSPLLFETGFEQNKNTSILNNVGIFSNGGLETTEPERKKPEPKPESETETEPEPKSEPEKEPEKEINKLEEEKARKEQPVSPITKPKFVDNNRPGLRDEVKVAVGIASLLYVLHQQSQKKPSEVLNNQQSNTLGDDASYLPTEGEVQHSEDEEKNEGTSRQVTNTRNK